MQSPSPIIIHNVIWYPIIIENRKEAAEIVNEARKYRTTRLKSAKQDAQAEIDNYKKQKEEELKILKKNTKG